MKTDKKMKKIKTPEIQDILKAVDKMKKTCKKALHSSKKLDTKLDKLKEFLSKLETINSDK